MAKYPVQYMLKDLMRQHEITQKNLAKMLEISEDTMHRKINGGSDWYLGELIAVAKILGLSIEEVFIIN